MYKLYLIFLNYVDKNNKELYKIFKEENKRGRENEKQK